MTKFKSEKGSVTVFVIVAFIFCMTILVNLYWTSTNYQVTVLQTEQSIKNTYGREVENVANIYEGLKNITVIIVNNV